MMTILFQTAMESISVPAGLQTRILAACRAEATPIIRQKPRYIPALATVAAMAVAVIAANPLMNYFVGEVVPDGASSAVSDLPSAVAPPASSHTTTTALTSDTAGVLVPTTMPTDDGVKQAYYGILKEMSLAELDAYFGRSVLPRWLPADLQCVDDGTVHGVYQRDERYIAEHTASWQYMLRYNFVRDEAIVRDVNRFFYQGTDGRDLSIEVATPPCPRTYIGDSTRFKETLVRQGIRIKLAYYDDAVGGAGYCYSAMLTVDGVEYYLAGWNIPRDEFIRIIDSLL